MVMVIIIVDGFVFGVVFLSKEGYFKFVLGMNMFGVIILM